MNRIELIEKLASAHGFTQAEAGRVVQTFVDTIVESVRKNDGLSIVGFGSFKLVSKAARKARNPRTGETVKVAARKVPKFTPGSAFLDAVDAKRAAARAAAGTPLKKAAAKKAAPAKKAAVAKTAAPAKKAAAPATKTAAPARKAAAKR